MSARPPLRRIFCPCGYTHRNRGDALLLLSLAHSLRQASGPEVRLSFASLDPVRDAAAYGLRVGPQPFGPAGLAVSLLRRSPARLRPFLAVGLAWAFIAFLALWAPVARRFPRLALLPLPRGWRYALDEARRADLVVAVPGGYLMAPEPEHFLWISHLCTLAVGVTLGTPTVLSPCSIGPFHPVYRRLARWLLVRVDRIVLREDESARFAEALGISPERLCFAPDMAFAYPFPTEPRPRRDAGELGHAPDRGVATGFAVGPDPTAAAGSAVGPGGEPEPGSAAARAPAAGRARPSVGISVRHHSFPGRSDAAMRWERYLDSVAAVTDWAVDELDAEVIFVPQATGAGGDDPDVARLVAGRCRGAHRIRRVEGVLDLDALYELYRSFDLFIGTRMHANLIALLAGVPVLAIAYEPKTVGIMRRLSLGEFTLGIDTISEAGAVAAAADLWRRRDAVRATIAREVDRSRRSATRWLDELDRLRPAAGSTPARSRRAEPVA